MRNLARAAVLSAACFLAFPAAGQSASGIVGSVTRAPVSADGDVAGAVTDFVINLAVDMDPSVPGTMLRAGESIRITLPAEFAFVDGGKFPLRDLFTAKDCKPGMLRCSTGVLLQGWPQHPILPSFPPGKAAQYSLRYEAASNTVTYTAEKDLVGVAMPGPGVKQMHLLMFGFRNPEQPGSYPIRVSIVHASGKVHASGIGNLLIRPDPAPSINVTSVFVPAENNPAKIKNPNTIYQKTTAGKAAPMPWNFLMWDTDGKAFAGVEIVQKNGAGGTLVQNGAVVGHFSISSPPGATGQKVSGGPSIKLPATPVIGKSFGAPIPVGRLTARFTAGSKPGRYFTTFALDGGNSVTMSVLAVK